MASNFNQSPNGCADMNTPAFVPVLAAWLLLGSGGHDGY